MVQRLLSKLLERQNKLMGRLQAPDGKPATQRASAPTDLPRRQAPAEPPEVEQRAVEAAMALLHQGAIEQARAALQPFDDTAEGSATLVLLGRIALSEGDAERALAYAARAEALDSLNPSVAKLMADVHRILGNVSDEMRYRRIRVFAQSEPKAADVVELVNALFSGGRTPTKAASKELWLAWAQLDRTKDVTDEHRIALAEKAFKLRHTDREARSAYAKIKPPGAQEIDVSANWVRLVTHTMDLGLAVLRDVDAGTPSRRPTMAELTEVYVDPLFDWIPIVEGGRVVLSDSMGRSPRLRSVDPASPLLLSTASKAFLRLRTDALRIDEPALVLGGSHDGFVHAVEHLGVLAVAEHLGLDPALKLAVNADLSAAQLARYAALGVGEGRLLRVPLGRPVVFTKAVIASKPMVGHAWIDPLLPAWFRSRFRGDGPRGTSARLLLLPDEAASTAVDDLLLARGFDRLDPRRVPFAELLGLLRNARCIAGHDAAALAGALHAQHGSQVLFAPMPGAEPALTAAVRALAEAGGQRFTLLPPSGTSAADLDAVLDG
jgi:tetratricopeptide (TPR) repeat protein